MSLYHSSVKKCQHVRIDRPLMKGERPRCRTGKGRGLKPHPFDLVSVKLTAIA